VVEPGSAEATLAAVYDEGAEAYEQHWAPALQRHARDLVATLPSPAEGEARVIVDIAVGSGALVPALREAAGAAGRVVTLDRSLGMLRRSSPEVPRAQSDAARLPLADASADVVVAAFVLFLLPDAPGAVAEAARVLRPGGRLLAATWGAQTGTGADPLIREALDAAGAPAFPELPRSDHLTDSPDAMAALLRDGFTDVVTTSRPLDAGFDPESALVMRTGCGALGWRFRRLDAAAQQELRARLVPRIAALGADALVDRSQVLLTSARRAG
jgi:ubiquinone/menaquinone biosynthesis C-methylase UbiE